MVRPGGLLVYATCSLEREEGHDRIERLLETIPSFERVPVTVDEIGGLAAALTAQGDVQTRPDLHRPSAADRLTEAGRTTVSVE